MNKDLKQLKKKAERSGWSVSLSNGGHLKWAHDQYGVFFSAQTPSDYRVITKVKARLRQAEAGRPIRR